MQSGFYYINTFGCQMNVHESEKIAGILSELGYISSLKEEDADIIVFNTCCVRESAETRFLGNLGNMKKLKEKKPNLIVAVCGCMPQNSGGKDRILKRFPEINIILGTHNIHLLRDFLLKSQKQQIEIWNEGQKTSHEITPYRTSGINAWVNIMYGCNNFCSYCIVPYVRGRERSRSIDEVVTDVRNLVSEGYKEITLLGQNVNSYGNDFVSGSNSFAELLGRLDSLDGKFRIRYMTSHPKDFSIETIKTIGESKKIGRLIHLPVQSGSDRILELMNRKYTSADYLKKIEQIHKYISGAGLSSDLIVGFPTETEDDFEKTIELISDVKYNNLYTFMYSRRSGTKADLMDGQIDLFTKKARIKRLIDEQFIIKNQLSANIVGKKLEILCDDFKDGFIFGKTSCGKIVKIKSSDDLTGNFVDVLITANKNSNLIGELTISE